MDWITLLIELVGLFILGTFIVIPISEFKQIFAKLRPRENRHDGEHDR